MELMIIISKLNETIPTDGNRDIAPPRTELVEFEKHLLSLHQFLTPQDSHSLVTENDPSILDTAELYRIAALVFLERVCRRRPRYAPEVEHLVKAGLTILQRLKVCAVMWPLFIIACEAETDEQRRIVLATFNISKKFRKAGNISWVQKLTEAVWKQDDLLTYSTIASTTVPLLRYGSSISASRQLPNFT